MGNIGKYVISFAAITMIAMVSGCGGGGGGGSSSAGSGPGPGTEPYPSRVLSWQPPTAYTDSTTLDPATDLDTFEIYVKDSPSFSPSDTPLAYVEAVDRTTREVRTSFDLANVGPYLGRGVTYYVSLRAVALTGGKSNFSPPASFSF